ncbi:MAG: ArnT family glycosyltransferase, partial [Terrimicrobiaceae bacterium]
MSAETRSPRAESLWRLAGIAFVVWVTLILTASQSTLWDRDEARYATAALEMEQSGNYLYPTFNHQLRAFQPVLIYWFMSAGIQVLGPNELGVRVTSTIAIALVCFLTGLMAREFLGTGTMAAVMVGTSPMLILTGTASTTDATLLLFILLAQWVFVRAWLDGPRRWHVPALGAAIGLAMLTKGPVGLAVPLLSIGTCLALAKGRSQAGPFAGKLVVAGFLGVAIFLAWGLPANAATGGEYWRIAIVERLPARLFTAMEDHGGEGLVPFLLHLPYYPLVLAIGFLPWTMYLVLVPRSFRNWESPAPEWARSPQGLRILLFGMIIPTFVLMTLVVSKLPHYIQPVFPWFAILAAAALQAAGSAAFAATAARRMRVAFVFLAMAGLVSAIALIAIPWLWPPLVSLRGVGAFLGIFMLGLLAVLAPFYWQGRLQTAARIHAVGMMAWLMACAFLVLPALEQIVKPAQLLAREIQPQIP